MTKEQRGRARIVRGDPETIARAQRLLDAYADLWRSRIDRLGELLDAD
ncbi:hypothetical protein GCM10025881_29060 [Pseudolysinimonas kribbensis]|uniref:Transcriptional regulator n=1 Tax=Pseudolysinimonas kribbensis TaxID=433641 RepID=A0ABQ6K7Z6_9MICO|nr:hypothetical protein GCM10025881_29060 [Pseudolysinimonas kribbensis]